MDVVVGGASKSAYRIGAAHVSEADSTWYLKHGLIEKAGIDNTDLAAFETLCERGDGIDGVKLVGGVERRNIDVAPIVLLGRYSDTGNRALRTRNTKIYFCDGKIVIEGFVEIGVQAEFHRQERTYFLLSRVLSNGNHLPGHTSSNSEYRHISSAMELDNQTAHQHPGTGS